MFSIPDFLDRAKAGAGVKTDYALAKLLGHRSQANVSNWRLEKAMPDERAIEALCKLSGDDPEHVAACIQSMRAANDDAAALWRRVAARLAKGKRAAMLFLVPILGYLVLSEWQQDLTPLALACTSSNLCVMSNGNHRALGVAARLAVSSAPATLTSPSPRRIASTIPLRRAALATVDCAASAGRRLA